MAIIQHRGARATAAPDPDPTPVPALSAADLASEIGTDATRAAHILASVEALVERYAPDAPAGVKREAVIRAAGWVAQAPSAGQRREDTGDVSTGFSPTMTGCLSASGAKGLLAPWRVRRAGAA